MHLPFVLCIAFHFECRSFSARSMIVKPSKSAVLAGAAAGARVYPGLVVLQHVSFPFGHISFPVAEFVSSSIFLICFPQMHHVSALQMCFNR